MIAQRPPDAAPAVQASAEKLPFGDGEFDAAMAILTIHHWSDIDTGLAELARVARRRVVIVTFDPDAWGKQWIVRDYIPEILEGSYEWKPSMAQILDALPNATVEVLRAPCDCTDRMFATLWARPEEYLDPRVRAATSVWHQLPPSVSSRALGQLARDLASGDWDDRYGYLRTTAELDVGLRLVKAELPVK
jgi:SAM-dependent methyltransferase